MFLLIQALCQLLIADNQIDNLIRLKTLICLRFFLFNLNDKNNRIFPAIFLTFFEPYLFIKSADICTKTVHFVHNSAFFSVIVSAIPSEDIR